MSLVLLIAFIATLAPTLGLAKASYSLEDVRGETKACETSLYHKEHPFLGCRAPNPYSAENLSQSFLEIDRGMAVSEIRGHIKTMAEIQIASSLEQLQRLGISPDSLELKNRLKDLEKLGYKIKIPNANKDPEFSEKYLIASLRYRELKKTESSRFLNEADRKSTKERVEMLEARFPLLVQQGFSRLQINASAMLKASDFVPKESKEESLILDNYLFNASPDKFSDLKLQGFKPTSAIGQLTKNYSLNQNPRINNELKNILNEDLQTSLANQLKALGKLESFETCEVMTLHSMVSLQAINSSPHPEDVFAQYCECQKSEAPVPENALLVSGLVAGAAGLICLAPTGISQVLACPAAAVLGWGTAGGQTVNFSHQLGRYNSFQDQGAVMRILESGQENKAEFKLLSTKSSELSREMVQENLVGLIGVGVGHVGFSGLTKLYTRSRISRSLTKLSTSERAKIENALQSLSKEDQTKIFVVLDKLDEESRAVLLKNPSLLSKELKGLRCEI